MTIEFSDPKYWSDISGRIMDKHRGNLEELAKACRISAQTNRVMLPDDKNSSAYVSFLKMVQGLETRNQEESVAKTAFLDEFLKL